MGKKEKSKKRMFYVAILLLLTLLWPNNLFGQSVEIRNYLLGDIDDFVYNGAGSVDDVYVDPAWYNLVAGHSWTVNDFDALGTYQAIPFTFLYELAPNEQVVGATLTLALISTVSDEGVGGVRNTIYAVWFE